MQAAPERRSSQQRPGKAKVVSSEEIVEARKKRDEKETGKCTPELWRGKKSREEEIEQANWGDAAIVLLYRHVLPESNPLLLIPPGFPRDHERLEPDR